MRNYAKKKKKQYKQRIYVVQPIISWTGHIVELLCTIANTWTGHKMVMCPFFSCPSKTQLRAYGVFRKKVTVMDSCLRVGDQECHSLSNGKTTSSAKNLANQLAKCFRTTNKCTVRKPWAVVLCLSDINILHRR
jgi:hypothetical protein